jgi:NADPH:quinone reductase-like Zn-dependent oxidoreductase
MQQQQKRNIDYRAKDWVVELDRLTNGKGVALITDPLGGNHWKKSYKALRSTGRLGMFGVSVATTSKLPGPLRLLPLALGTPFFHPLALMSANKSVFGVNLGHMWHESDMIAGWMEILLKAVADGWVRPHVDKSFPLAQAGEAQTYIEERWMLSLRRCTLSGITFP